nr:retrovirus-related Pol polyprotein from transposon 17.6 [Tanacetum cinerariifolium]
SGTLSSNTIANPKSDLKAITTRSGVSYDGPQIPPPVVENKPAATKDTVNPTNNGITEDVQPQTVQSKPLTSEPAIAPVSASKPNPKASIPYPSRRNDERNREKANNQIEKFYQIFKDMSFEISFADTLILMPKFASTLKALIENKEKLSKMALTPLNEHYSAVLLKKLPKKLEDPGKFLIPCDFPGMAECLALADLGASINLMPLSVCKKLSLFDLTPTCMTLKLADRSISHPVRVAEDVYVKVDRKSFNRCVQSDITAKRIDVIDIACEEYSHEVLGFSDTISSGSPTPSYDPIVSATSPTLTPFENSDFLLKERCMMAIFHDMIEKTMKVFMDYFFVFRNSFQRCLSHLEKMLKRCEDANLCLNWEKSHFMVKEGIVLGHKISKQGIEVDKAKVDVISKLPHPTTVKECVDAFQTLKRKLTEAPILIAPDWDMPFELMCDASDFAIGAVLGHVKISISGQHIMPARP